MAVIKALQEHPEGWILIQKLKNALKQRKYRSPSNGRKACTFSLPNSTVTQLRRLARQRQQTETSIVTSLIDDAEQRSQKDSEQVKKLKEALVLERERRASESDSYKAQLEEAMKQLGNHLQRLSMWETIHGESLPNSDLDEAAIKQLVERKMEQARTALRYVAQEGLLSNSRAR